MSNFAQSLKDINQRLFKWSNIYGYEVGVKGDKRFSDNVASIDNKTINQIYRDMNIIDSSKRWDIYLNIWRQWANLNTDLIHDLLLHVSANNFYIRDRKARNDINPAAALSNILNSNHTPMFSRPTMKTIVGQDKAKNV
jgi:hypothetical protein